MASVFSGAHFQILSGNKVYNFAQQHGSAADGNHDACGELQILAPVAAVVIGVKVGRVVHGGLLLQ